MNFDKINFIPLRLKDEITKNVYEKGILEEIRIRKNRNAYIIVSGKNIVLNIIIHDEEMLEIIQKITRNSLYAYRDTIVNGYISFEYGIRIGVIGSANVENNSIIGISDINELAIRIPNNISVNVDDLLDLVRANSVLIYSPPGEGKTTLLRALIRELSVGHLGKRLGVIDTRDELICDFDNKEALVSVLSKYPRENGIEIAIRTMNPQIIMCDEIGDAKDSRAFLEAQGIGVPIIATCHGSSIKEILSHTGIRNLHVNSIFDYYIGIKRGNNMDFIYTVHSWRDANDCL